ncbi:hypothetical protein DGMP_03440 [Desulfomarina profundi]|uniref:HPr kinase/phosphorylase C-terminal domain-containing protein n=1 Tax=Desulfomarina profundi TaxID=2772557 RepID=A0A8D5FQN6_9BACT|nr:hypothetical protein DGMP_03440 [Desulfomarina profundi]
MYFYTVYGYTLRSDFLLPGFPESRSLQSQLIIEKQPGFSPETFPDKSLTLTLRGDNFLNITWHGVASYTVYDGSQVSVIREQNSHPALVLQPFYSIVPASILNQNKLFVLHGNCVEVNGSTIALIGAKGQGKSTLTAALLAKGHRLVADDVTAIDTESLRPQVLPGIPNLKVWADTAKATGINLSKLKKINPYIEKYNYVLPNHFCNRKLPLETIIFLQEGKEVKIEKTQASQGMLYLIGNHYLSRYPQVFTAKEHKRIFEQSAFLSRTTRLLTLNYPKNLKVLNTVTSLIEALQASKKKGVSINDTPFLKA